jgi:DNA/RNA-binding domain of Phe-tRNA-synthetase-like protein
MISVEFEAKLAQEKIQIGIAAIEIQNFHQLVPEYNLNFLLNKTINEIKTQYTLDTIKENAIIAAYRSFYWKFLNIDPTKTRPASEALIRRILGDKPFPKIFCFVDTYNLASVQSLISLGAYDVEKIRYPIIIRHSTPKDLFYAIGKGEQKLPDGVLVTSDKAGIILCQYPYRDSENTMIKKQTTNILLLAYGVNNIEKNQIDKGIDACLTNLDLLRMQNIIEFHQSEIQFFKNY